MYGEYTRRRRKSVTKWVEIHGHRRLCFFKGEKINFVVTLTLAQYVAHKAYMFLETTRNVCQVPLRDVVDLLQKEMVSPDEPTPFMRFLVAELHKTCSYREDQNGALSKVIVDRNTDLHSLGNVDWEAVLRSLIDSDPHYFDRLIERNGLLSQF